jgi:hypothetical protein
MPQRVENRIYRKHCIPFSTASTTLLGILFDGADDLLVTCTLAVRTSFGPAKLHTSGPSLQQTRRINPRCILLLLPAVAEQGNLQVSRFGWGRPVTELLCGGNVCSDDVISAMTSQFQRVHRLRFWQKLLFFKMIVFLPDRSTCSRLNEFK